MTFRKNSGFAERVLTRIQHNTYVNTKLRGIKETCTSVVISSYCEQHQAWWWPVNEAIVILGAYVYKHTQQPKIYMSKSRRYSVQVIYTT